MDESEVQKIETGEVKRRGITVINRESTVIDSGPGTICRWAEVG